MVDSTAIAASPGLADSHSAPEGASNAADADVERVYHDHYAFVWRNARRLGASDDMVDDVTHEVFLIVARKLADFEGRSDIRTWLFAITLRVVRAMQRHRGSYARRLERYAHFKQTEAPVQPHEQSDAAYLLRQLLARLDDKRKLVFILAELEGMTSAEIASELEIPVGTVDTRLRAARLKLRRWLEKDITNTRRFNP